MSELNVDTINEQTAANGVTIDGVKLKDNAVETDTISEKTSGSGVTIDSLQVKDGGIQAATGIPLQVVTYQNIITNSNTITSSSFTDITYDGSNRIEIKITPKQADSKILLISNVQTYHEYAGYVANVRALRDISGGSSDTLVQSYRFRDEDTPNNYNLNTPIAYNFVDEPNTTSEVTYHFEGKIENSNGEFAWVTASDNDRGQSFFLWEIGV